MLTICKNVLHAYSAPRFTFPRCNAVFPPYGDSKSGFYDAFPSVRMFYMLTARLGSLFLAVTLFFHLTAIVEEDSTMLYHL
ncbi:hypothetical protein PAECIP111893_00594 [Paenibacillus plantiphilus]|uniref:Uncharacterized protein n=1 Tax=Paenibacillus plantiphilus TaxID=2905650 RepID=A0ABM9BV10_9BACL|nr:hypothetical protein PAECIP111893_00594 [Paenibacillus plantiphilus]